MTEFSRILAFFQRDEAYRAEQQRIADAYRAQQRSSDAAYWQDANNRAAQERQRVETSYTIYNAQTANAYWNDDAQRRNTIFRHQKQQEDAAHRQVVTEQQAEINARRATYANDAKGVIAWLSRNVRR